jgi:two-component system response regulator HydG
MKVMRQAKDLDPDIPVVIITAYAEIHGAVKAIKAGAHDYLSKPFDNQEVIRVIHRALAERELKQRLKELSIRRRKTKSQKMGNGFLKNIECLP